MTLADSSTAVREAPSAAELLAGVLAALEASEPRGLDRLVWGAACRGDAATLKYLLAKGGRPVWMLADRAEGDERRSSLCMAAKEGHEAAVSHLLTALMAGADEDGQADRGYALLLAAQAGHGAVVGRLVKAGVDVNRATTEDGSTPLLFAAGEGHGDVVEMLIGSGARVDQARTSFGSTPLLRAAQNGHREVVGHLIKAGADVNKATTDNGSTPLILAARNGHAGVVRQLIEAGADMNRARTDGCTALKLALESGRNEAALLLIRRGASPAGLDMPKVLELLSWSAERMETKDREVQGLVRGIPEWCAQAARGGCGAGAD